MQDTRAEGKIIRLDARRSAPGATPAARVEAAWDAARDGALLPRHDEIAPARLGTDLAHVFVLDRIAPGLARIAVAGRHLSDLLGTEAEGLPFAALMHPDARDALRDAMSAVFEEPAVVRMALLSRGGFARPELRGALVLLPLAGERGVVTRVLGAFDAGTRPGRRPRRFEIDGQERRGLVGYARPLAPPRRQGMAETGAPYLRLVRDPA